MTGVKIISPISPQCITCKRKVKYVSEWTWLIKWSKGWPNMSWTFCSIQDRWLTISWQGTQRLCLVPTPAMFAWCPVELASVRDQAEQTEVMRRKIGKHCIHKMLSRYTQISWLSKYVFLTLFSETIRGWNWLVQAYISVYDVEFYRKKSWPISI